MKISTILDHIDSGHMALTLKEGPELLKLVNAAGFRYFSEVERFKEYVEREAAAWTRTAMESEYAATPRRVRNVRMRYVVPMINEIRMRILEEHA